jgi:GDPmannose 4,6-dehydratase
MARNYREGYKMPIWNGILFNHESPRRGETFVTRKITRGIARIIAQKEKYLYLGNLEAKRDWGYAPEYIECMWRMLQCDTPDDFVVGTGESHRVAEFLELAFAYAGLKMKECVRIDPAYFRPTEPSELVAEPARAQKKLGWEPRIKFHDLIKVMVDADMRLGGLKPIGEGDAILRKKFPEKWWQTD